MSGESTRRPVMMFGESTCGFGGWQSSAMRAAVVTLRESSAVRAVSPTDTAGWRESVFFGWSSKDGYRSQGSDEEGEKGREMHDWLLLIVVVGVVEVGCWGGVCF